MDLDKLKQDWNSISLKIDRLEEENLEIRRRLCCTNVQTSQQSLARKYTHFSWLGMSLPVLAFLMWHVLETPLWLCIIYSVFGIIQAIAFQCFASYIRHSDYMSMPVAESLRHALIIRKTQFRFLLGSIILGLAVIIPLFRYFFQAGDSSAFIGACIGGVIGGIIGIRKDIEMFRLSKKMINDLRDFTNDENTTTSLS